MRSEQLEILYRIIDTEIMALKRWLQAIQELFSVLSQRSDDAPQSARGTLDYSEPASKYSDDQPRDDLGRFALVGGSGSPGKGEMNIDKAVAFLNAKADPGPPGKRLCAPYVREVIEKGGGVTLVKHPIPAKEYHPYLKKYFDEVTPTPQADYSPKTGDIAVFQPPPIHNNQDGHIQMYNGEEWVSDFKQGKDKRNCWPGPDYRGQKPPYAIYRPRDWKPKPENV